jgi:succinyl-CoA synthetase alpha subunit
MTILVGPDTLVVCQGITGRTATYHAERMMAYGTPLVAGITPGKGGIRHLGLPVFDTVAEAVAMTGANTTIIFVPPARAAEAIIEAADASLELAVCVTERVPILDMVRVKRSLEGGRMRLVGPNSQGILAPGVVQLGVMTTVNARKGDIGIVSRSASLTSEVVAQVTEAGLGQSTTVGVGGDPVHGLNLAECVALFLDDPDTKGIILIGEIGGSEEEKVAELVAHLNPAKPIVGFIAGRHAPLERRMGHAGALITPALGAAEPKIAALEAAGVRMAKQAHLVGETMRSALMDQRA